MKKQIFLISSSRFQGGNLFAHCASSLQEFLGPIRRNDKILFFPYALKDHDGYTAMITKAFSGMGYNNVISIHNCTEPLKLIASPKVKAIFMGGGNTFRLLRELRDKEMIETIKDRVYAGMKYIGSSAGSNMACPTIKTTNDMPIIAVPSFTALNLVPFQINPHFIPGSLVPTHMGETRETRIKEFHEENDYPVIGLTEANWLIVNDKEVVLHGGKSAFIFEKGKEVRMWKPGTPFVLSH